MWRKALICGGGAIRRQFSHPLSQRHWRAMGLRPSSTTAEAVNSMILRSLKDHYVEVSKMTPPPKISPPSPYTIVKGALDSGGPVLKRVFRDEEICLSVMRLTDIDPGESRGDNSDSVVNQLFLHVDISKQGQEESLHFLCGLYPDALGIHSVSMRPKADTSGFLVVPTKYSGPVFEEIDEKLRDALHGYIEERGINESLFPFLQAWLYVKDHKDLMRWFKTVGLFVNENQKPLPAR